MGPKKPTGLLPVFLLVLEKLSNRGPIIIQDSIPGFAIFKKKTGISPEIPVFFLKIDKKPGIFDGYIPALGMRKISPPLWYAPCEVLRPLLVNACVSCVPEVFVAITK